MGGSKDDGNRTEREVRKRRKEEGKREKGWKERRGEGEKGKKGEMGGMVHIAGRQTAEKRKFNQKLLKFKNCRTYLPSPITAKFSVRECT